MAEIAADATNTSALTPIQLYDNSRISGMKNCPRYFLFRYILDWAPAQTSLPLIFGSSWHAAMDVIWENYKDAVKNTTEVVTLGTAAFVECWVERGMTHPDDMSPDNIDDWNPRLPQVASEMMYEYIDARSHIFTDPSFELLSVEEPFAIPLDPNNPNLFYVGRLDKKVRFRKSVIAIEHKTTTAYKKDGFFRNDWIDSFSLSAQVDGYQFRLRSEYGKEAGGVYIDGALVHKTVHEGFKFIPINRQEMYIDAWLFDTHYWISEIERHKAIYKERAGLDTPYLAAFPKNTESCTKYGRCQFFDICTSVMNPAKLDGAPLGYKVEPWSPFEEIALEKIGFTRDRTNEPPPKVWEKITDPDDVRNSE